MRRIPGAGRRAALAARAGGNYFAERLGEFPARRMRAWLMQAGRTRGWSVALVIVAGADRAHYAAGRKGDV
ncbi:MAG TPA: hypothetical protein VKH34_16190 [Vicinamibacterales bacterium]|nr:hypothetical protein [Vicinamibacterales bacterium]